jgi:hypothetical protein
MHSVNSAHPKSASTPGDSMAIGDDNAKEADDFGYCIRFPVYDTGFVDRAPGPARSPAKSRLSRPYSAAKWLIGAKSLVYLLLLALICGPPHCAKMDVHYGNLTT